MRAMVAVLLMICIAGFGAAPQDPQLKVKRKRSEVQVRDKSKPVRAALEAQYARMAQAYYDDDPEPVLSLRTPDFAVQLPDGRRWTREESEAYVRAGFDQVKRTLRVAFDIGTLNVRGDTAIAEIHQQWKREQDMGGKLRRVETEARHREWWLNTSEGWRLFFIDDVRSGVWKVDGKRVDPSKPFDPDAPPYEPR